MKTLVQFFEEKRGIADNGAYVRSKAPEVFRGSALVLSEDFTRPPENGARIIIAFYSLPDLKLVDALLKASRETKNVPDSVEVFDVLGCKSVQDVDCLIPGIAPVYAHPVVGAWRNGELVQKGSGIRESRRIILLLT